MAAQAERAEQEGWQSIQARRQGWLVGQGIAGRIDQVGRQAGRSRCQQLTAEQSGR
jgi:hypothetical protein